MRTVLNETQRERDEELARYLGVPIESVTSVKLDIGVGPVVHQGNHIKADSYDFLYKSLGEDDTVRVLRTLSNFNVVKRKKLILNAMRHMGNLRKKRVLDFGCGPGAHGIHFLQYGASVDFLDVVGPVYNFARWRVKNRELENKAGFLNPQTDLLKKTYDVVLCVDVLEHVAMPMREFARLLRAAKHGAFFLLQIGYHLNPRQGHFKQSIGRLRTNKFQKYMRKNLDPLESAELTKAEGRRCYYFRRR